MKQDVCKAKYSFVYIMLLIVFALGCPTSCKGIAYKPVCGSDKKIHRNECKLKQSACVYGKNITMVPDQLCFNSELRRCT